MFHIFTSFTLISFSLTAFPLPFLCPSASLSRPQFLAVFPPVRLHSLHLFFHHSSIIVTLLCLSLSSQPLMKQSLWGSGWNSAGVPWGRDHRGRGVGMAVPVSLGQISPMKKPFSSGSVIAPPKFPRSGASLGPKTWNDDMFRTDNNSNTLMPLQVQTQCVCVWICVWERKGLKCDTNYYYFCKSMSVEHILILLTLKWYTEAAWTQRQREHRDIILVWT